jgi:hypothetical protein
VIKGIYDLDPDGVRIVVAWDKFTPGTSVFIPCINTTAALRQIDEVTDAHDWVVTTRVRIENRQRGVRIWRVA